MMPEPKIINIGDPVKPESGNELSDFAKRLVEPLSKHGWPRWLVFTAAIIGVIYLLNPTAGFLELIPDNIPFLGNLDEGVAVMLILAGLVEFFEGKKPL